VDDIKEWCKTIGGDAYTAGAAFAAPTAELGQQPIENAAPTLSKKKFLYVSSYKLFFIFMKISGISGQFFFQSLSFSLSFMFVLFMPFLFYGPPYKHSVAK
jgi:hypothetical protein